MMMKTLKLFVLIILASFLGTQALAAGKQPLKKAPAKKAVVKHNLANFFIYQPLAIAPIASVTTQEIHSLVTHQKHSFSELKPIKLFSSNNDNKNSLNHLLIDYQNDSNNLGLALESFGNLNSASNQNYIKNPAEVSDLGIYANAVNAQFNHFASGFDLKPLVNLSEDSMFYARLGAAMSKKKFLSTPEYLNQEGSLINEEAENSDNILGWRLGGGIAKNLTSKVALTLDYIYSEYNNVNSSPFQTIFNSNSIPNNKPDSNTQSILFGINYKL